MVEALKNSTPKVFISYGWTSQDYVSWTIGIAERLMADGVEVVIDKWNLEPGQDKFVFMERMVQDASINHVLMLLNRVYKEKSNAREGGVGTEAQILSSELYASVDQTKFIPIISEKNDKGEPFLPTYLKNLIYVDLSNEEKFEEEYESLLRFIFKRPQYVKPKLGTAPSFLFEDKENDSVVNLAEKKLLGSLRGGTRNSKQLCKEYVECLLSKLDNYRIHNTSGDSLEFGRIALEKFKEMTNLRDSYLGVVSELCKIGIVEQFVVIFGFFNQTEKFFRPMGGRSSWYENEFDNFALFLFELQITTLALAMKYQRFDLIKVILAKTFIRYAEASYQNEPIEKRLRNSYDFFKKIHSIGEYYKSITGQNYFEPIVEILKERIYQGLSLTDLIESDFLFHFYRVPSDQYEQYFPRFAIYQDKCGFDFISQTVYREFFKSFLELFGCKTKEEFIEKFGKGNFPYESVTVGNYARIMRLLFVVKPDFLGTLD